jgi:hypothetical protein
VRDPSPVEKRDDPGVDPSFRPSALLEFFRERRDLVGMQQADILGDPALVEPPASKAFVRSSNDTRVDASLLWLAVPCDVVEVDHPVMAATVKRVRQELTGPTGGLAATSQKRYGGSEWVLTTAFLALVDLRRGDRRSAEAGLNWIEAQATPALELPEHVPHGVQSPHMLDRWRGRWGAPTCPLLWSHAMHLLLLDGLATEPHANAASRSELESARRAVAAELYLLVLATARVGVKPSAAPSAPGAAHRPRGRGRGGAVAIRVLAVRARVVRPAGVGSRRGR